MLMLAMVKGIGASSVHMFTIFSLHCPPLDMLPVGQDGGKRMGLNFDRVKYWLSVGAQPSEPVQRILFRACVLPPPPMLAMTRKGGPRDTRPVDALSGRYLTPESPEAADQSEYGENEAGEDGDKPNP
ncbi:hypothetical protein COCNU_scaffold012601G000080 [Cocos nucifera]|nr:hypothetical protein [Cocos nucifera]